MGFLLKFFLISIILSWLFRTVIRYFTRNFMDNSNGRRQTYQRRPQRREGEIQIDKRPGNDKKIKKDMGEYVDYEEII